MEPNWGASLGVRAKHTNICARVVYPVNNVYRSTITVPAIKGLALANYKSGGGPCTALSCFLCCNCNCSIYVCIDSHGRLRINIIAPVSMYSSLQ